MALPLVLAILALILIPFVPNLVRLRIRFLRWIHWDWAVNIHERHFRGLVMSVRAGLFIIAIVFIYVAFRT